MNELRTLSAGDADGVTADLQPLSRADVGRFHRGQLDADTLVRWVERARGLSAPEAGAQGELIPNGTGWLVGVGGARRRLLPRLSKWADLSAFLSGMGPLWSALLELPRHLLISMSLGVLPPLLLIGGTEWLARRWFVRRLTRATRPVRLIDSPAGTLVRLTGVIASQPTVPSLFRGAPAVLFRNRIGGVDETRGIDFDLVLEDGQRVRVSVRRAQLLDPPRRTREPPQCGPVSTEVRLLDDVYRLRSDLDPVRGSPLVSRLFVRARYESSVGPGDKVEVCGILHHEAAPDEVTPFTRHLPVRFVIRATEATLLIVRSVPPAPAADVPDQIPKLSTIQPSRM